mmetsp:Transcript_71099/g.211977  ORF Transcript_71099/g.211977 Transcript_71099/m.211977 type:complete len:277 (-) Transcript_71099:1295-2125(-)
MQSTHVSASASSEHAQARVGSARQATRAAGHSKPMRRRCHLAVSMSSTHSTRPQRGTAASSASAARGPCRCRAAARPQTAEQSTRTTRDSSASQGSGGPSVAMASAPGPKRQEAYSAQMPMVSRSEPRSRQAPPSPVQRSSRQSLARSRRGSPTPANSQSMRARIRPLPSQRALPRCQSKWQSAGGSSGTACCPSRVLTASTARTASGWPDPAARPARYARCSRQSSNLGRGSVSTPSRLREWSLAMVRRRKLVSAPSAARTASPASFSSRCSTKL